ncbi:MAG: hypothetical protein KDC85_04475 [Saprospiraceae bacterium]|nr:hypothetical protein [Saprospiraceae bacterium]MCB9322807.1 hypothetical protein [Lewinellaceae bacterium]
MKIKTLILGILLACSFQLASQSYDISMGVRLGTDKGITYKQRIAKRVTLEGIIQSSFQREEAMVTLLAEKHMPFITRRVNFYTGGGFHKGWLSIPESNLPVKDPFGVTLIAGLEFTAARINVSWDFKPAINIVGGEKRIYSQTGVSVRYVIKKRKVLNLRQNGNKKKKINWKFWDQ